MAKQARRGSKRPADVPKVKRIKRSLRRLQRQLDDLSIQGEFSQVKKRKISAAIQLLKVINHPGVLECVDPPTEDGGWGIIPTKKKK